MLQKVVDQYIGSFEAFSRDEIVRHLDALGSNWRWTVPPEESGDYALQIARQPLQSTSIVHAAHSSRLDGLVMQDISRVCIVFVLAGEVEIYDRRMRQASRISAGQVASIKGKVGGQLHIKPHSSWLMFQIPESKLRQYFEELTGEPYIQEFALKPTDFRKSDAQGLYHTLRRAEEDLKAATPAERALLARAYKELALIKLFATLPHNLKDAFDRGTLGAAPRQLLKAEAFLRDNLYNPVTLKEIANAAGCSSRALQRMFHTYRADTPMGMLCNYRLAAAHGALKSGLAESITDLAMSLQFSNPGRFSVLYRSVYGLSPSSDLRNARKREDAK
ncbi:helix-turn-helix transcriptional regulator [Rhizobium rhizogenes]